MSIDNGGCEIKYFNIYSDQGLNSDPRTLINQTQINPFVNHFNFDLTNYVTNLNLKEKKINIRVDGANKI